jgi:preprotein translocase subunit YajC
MMPFLYFPEDKSEYIPAVITLAIFIIFAVIALYFMIKKSRKDEEDFKEKYNQQLENASNKDKSNY